MTSDEQEDGPGTTDHFVYVICLKKAGKQVGPVKVGISATPYDRMSALQTGHYDELSMMFCFSMPDSASARRIERGFHEVYKLRRLKGEWFDMEPLTAVVNLCHAIETFVEVVLGFKGAGAENCLDLTGVYLARQRIAALAQRMAPKTGSETEH